MSSRTNEEGGEKDWEESTFRGKKSLCRKCSSETENIFSTVLNAGRSIDSSSENLSGKEEEERRSRFPLSLPINTPLLIPRGRVPTAFSIRVERGFSANLSATTPFRIFLSFLFSVRTKKSHRLFIIIVVKSIGSLNYRERKNRASIEETVISRCLARAGT